MVFHFSQVPLAPLSGYLVQEVHDSLTLHREDLDKFGARGAFGVTVCATDGPYEIQRSTFSHCLSRESAPPRASSGASRKFSVARDKTLVSGVPPREKRSSPTHEQCVDDDLVQATFRRRSVKTHRTIQRQERQEHGQLPTTHQTCIPNQASNMNMSNVGDWTRHIDTCCERKDSARICVRAKSVLCRRQSKLTCPLVCLISSTAKRTEAPKDVV